MLILASLATLLTTLSLGPAGAAPAARARLTPERVEAILTAPERRIRAMDPGLAQLLAEGVQRSRTFARLMLAIDDSDLIVYIELNRDLPTNLDGRLMIVPARHAQRYVRIEVAPRGNDDDLIATLAHELQHAMEVAESRDVHDEPGLVALYKRIGHSTGGRHEFDTIAARDMGRLVKSELAG